ncbi:MAG: pyridoxamine 5'-phosphate oxidase family protein [Pedobacter sp.]|nr:MAG: pyridoxamine 5'-phosphate oxidase family protein [Pedobacter sp.]
MDKSPKHLIPSRSAKRAQFDAEAIYPILDEALFCTMSFALDDKPFSIPTSFVRYENKIYIHGSVGSHFIRELEKGIPACITVMIADDLVLAKAPLSHSVNYRSVIIFATAEKIEDPQIKLDSFEWLIEKFAPGRWNSLRTTTESEIRRTAVLAFDLKESSAKTRQGMPNDEPEDKELPIWSGLLPISKQKLALIPDQSSVNLPIPEHLL